MSVVAVAGVVAASIIGYTQIGNAAAVNPNCTLIVPANPLTAAGLATPYQLVATNPEKGPCNEANANQSAFVQGAIIDAAGKITLYDPLVVDKGTQALAAPAPAVVPAGATVGLWFGFNGTNLTLKAADDANTLRMANCVNGLEESVFGQFAYCNAPAFFQAANGAIMAGKLAVPAVAMAKDGMPCPTVRDFSLVDMDQSDNVLSHYLANANGQTGQANAATRAALGMAAQVDLANGSDNRLLDVFVLPTLGCTPFMAANQSLNGMPTSSLPLNELQAAAGQKAPIALVPLTDPMTMVEARQNAVKTNLYRMGVNQAPLSAADNGNGTTYCQNLFVNPNGIQRVFRDMAMFALGPSPAPAMANNLFTFLAMRGNQSFTGLNCTNLLNMANPIQLTMNGNGVVVAATFMPAAAKPMPRQR
ncbi:MAG TPA: hypothetical protein VJT31_25150 [Rugosimonospora sp.]|nr:hypothetical protein [Rugosimonospora sp.]